MVAVRYEPGGLVPSDGHYVLVGHYGEATDVVVWRQQGEWFPAALSPDNVIAPVSFVQLFMEGGVPTSVAA